MMTVAALVLVVDQITKLLVLRYLGAFDERVVVDGFFKLVHWTNRGAAWSLFNQVAGSNQVLALFALATVVVLFLARRHFDFHTRGGQVALGLIIGGVFGNLLDRAFRGAVIDFLFFYVQRRDGEIIGFPAFNVADSAICTGVGLLVLLSWQRPRVGEESCKSSPSPKG